MADAYSMSFTTLNYSGMLFNKGDIRTPLSTIIGGKLRNTNSVEFVTGQEYSTGGGSQPSISEEASLTAPDATYITRAQNTNVTQIFQEAVGVSYGHMSNMGTLAGINVAGQSANPVNEFDFQVAARMAKIARDIEFTFIQGVYNKAANDSQANRTRGLANAITTNVHDMGGKALGIWDIAELLKTMYENNAPTTGLTVWADATTIQQINADAAQNGLTVVPAARDINGIALDSVVTPLGTVYLKIGECLPAGTAFILNLGVLAPVGQPTPGKGNFFLEELGKAGAGSKYQIFGQMGLDYGPEFYHGKFTNISTNFTAPEGRKVVVAGAVGTIQTANGIVSVNLDKSTVEASDTAKVAVDSITYVVPPATAPTVAYLWQVRAKTGTTWTDLTSSYTGYNTAELTVKAADAEKHYRCKVTVSGSVADTAYSAECTVAAAG